MKHKVRVMVEVLYDPDEFEHPDEAEEGARDLVMHALDSVHPSEYGFDEDWDWKADAVCPRCDGPLYVPAPVEFPHPPTRPPGPSRSDNATLVCEPCGTEEALLDAGFDSTRVREEQDEWPVRRRFQLEVSKR
jgi:hypothetical protein